MDALVSYFRSGDAMRSRTVSDRVHSVVLDIPAPPASLLADWQRQVMVQLELAAGDIEPMPLGRTRLRWPQLRDCFRAAQDWMATLDMPDVLAEADVALMGSRGTRYHHDGARYGGMAFCNLFLSDASGTDLHFPASGNRVALARGTAVLFDPSQPHAIVQQGADSFDAGHFDAAQVPPQVFLTWELPVEQERLAQVLGIRYDVGAAVHGPVTEEQVRRSGAPARVCPSTGRWQAL